MDEKIELCCKPEPAVAWRLLGMQGKADEEIQRILDSELAALRVIVKPTALVRRFRADKEFMESMRRVRANEEFMESVWRVRADEEFMESVRRVRANEEFMESVRRVRADETFLTPVQGVCGDGAFAEPARYMSGEDGFLMGSLLAVEEGLLAVLLTVGPVDDYVSGLFSKGEHLRALVADALLSAWLFAMDTTVQKEIGAWCVRHGFGVCGRLEAPGDIPMEMHRVICERLDSEERAGVHVNDGCMLVPEKSMCYLLRLDRECGRFAMGHDCGRCQKKGCGDGCNALR